MRLYPIWHHHRHRHQQTRKKEEEEEARHWNKRKHIFYVLQKGGERERVQDCGYIPWLASILLIRILKAGNNESEREKMVLFLSIFNSPNQPLNSPPLDFFLSPHLLCGPHFLLVNPDLVLHSDSYVLLKFVVVFVVGWRFRNIFFSPSSKLTKRSRILLYSDVWAPYFTLGWSPILYNRVKERGKKSNLILIFFSPLTRNSSRLRDDTNKMERIRGRENKLLPLISFIFASFITRFLSSLPASRLLVNCFPFE